MTQSLIRFDDDLTGYCTNVQLEEAGEKNAETLGDEECDTCDHAVPAMPEPQE